MGHPPRSLRGGAAEHTGGSPVTATVWCSPHTARLWRIDYPAGSDITVKLPLADLMPGRGPHLEILNDGGAAITIELRPGATPLTLSLPIDRLASLAVVNDPSVLPAAGQPAAEAERWAAIVYEVGTQSGFGLLVPP